MSQTILSSISIIIGIFNIYFSYRLGKIALKEKFLLNNYSQRYKLFYIPYIQKLYGIFITDYSIIQEMNFNSRNIFFELIMNNIEYIDKNTSLKIPAFYNAFLNMLEFEENSTGFENSPIMFDLAFTEITLSILKETKRLSQQLKLPDTTEILLASLQEHYVQLHNIEYQYNK